LRSLPPLPRGLTGFTVLSIDPLTTYEQIIALVRTSNPQAADQVPAFEAAVRQQLGVDLRRDLLAHLGPKLSLYSQPPPPEVAGNPAAAMMATYTGLTISAQVRGDVAFARSLDSLIPAINRIIQAQQATARRGQGGPNAPAIAFRKEAGARPSYVLDLPPGSLPPGVLSMFRPTITLGKVQLVLAATTDAAERAVGLSTAPAE